MLPPKLELARLELLYYPERFMGDEDSGKAIAGKTKQLRDKLHDQIVNAGTDSEVEEGSRCVAGRDVLDRQRTKERG